ncbi:acyl-CoA N-acyltransferase [Circinella umbellata]|nr:acyl-CoA N-acyltransferase [Circinella umbellata]
MVQLNYHIREVTIESLQYTDSVVKTVNEAYQTGDSWTKARDTFDFDVPRTNAEEINGLIKENVCNKKTHILIYVFDTTNEEKSVIGTLLASYPNDKGESEFTLLSVAPQYQSKGIGGQLMEYMFNRIKLMGATTVVLDLLDNRIDLVAWYKKLGFIEVGKKEFKWRGNTIAGVSSLLMKKGI